MKSEEANSGDARQKVFMGVEAGAACGSHKGTEQEGSRDEPRVFTAPEGHCPWSHPTRHVCAVVRTKAEAFGGVRRPLASRQSNKLGASRQENIREGSRRKNIREGARRREHSGSSEPNIEIVRDARSTMKDFREDPHRDQNSTQGAHRSSSKKLFREALQRSSSEKLFTKKQEKKSMAFTAVHGSAIEGGCCDSNATVHARGYGQDGD